MASLARAFPSKTITQYTAKMFLMRTLAFLAALVVILQSLDLLAETSKILAVSGNDEGDVWRYVSLRAPQIIAQFLPFSVLLATLVTLATLNQNSEVVIFKAAGISAHQILAPLFVAALGIATINFLFNELVLVKTNTRLAAWQSVNYGPVPTSGTSLNRVWVRAGDDLFHAQSVAGSGEATRLSDLTIYDREDNRLVRVVRAATARHVSGGWQLTDARSFDVVSGTQTASAELRYDSNATPDRFTATDVKAEQTPMWKLAADVKALRLAGRPVASLEGALHHKLSGPLSALLMPLLGSVAAFGLARSGHLFVRAVIGMFLGFAFFVADNFMLAMGDFGTVPPWLAGWGPIMLFFLIGEAVLIRTEE